MIAILPTRRCTGRATREVVDPPPLRPGWYTSPAYQDILPLRRENSTGPTFLVDGVGADHRATDILA